MSISLHQITINGRPEWVHVSTRGATRIARRFPGTFVFEPSTSSRCLSLSQIGKLLKIAPPGIASEDEWRRILDLLGTISEDELDRAIQPPALIPRSKMRTLFAECQQKTSLAEQLEWARLQSAQAIANAFLESVQQLSTYENGEAFHPARDPLPLPVNGMRIRSTRDLAILLRAQRTVREPDDSSLDCSYVDYELVPLRTTGKARYEDGKKGTTWVRLDLLLVGDRPIIAEVKLRQDENPFYALIQALAAAAELATPAQRHRLNQHYPRLADTLDKLDIYLILYQWKNNGPSWHGLLDHTERMCRELQPLLREHIFRIVIIDAHQADGLVRFQPLPANTATGLTNAR